MNAESYFQIKTRKSHIEWLDNQIPVTKLKDFKINIFFTYYTFYIYLMAGTLLTMCFLYRGVKELLLTNGPILTIFGVLIGNTNYSSFNLWKSEMWDKHLDSKSATPTNPHYA